jgi:Domain of unknown function (DUF4160)
VRHDAGVPTIARFFGILIQMYPEDHNPPHFHALYSGHKAVIDIRTRELMAGSLPGNQLKRVIAWAELNEAMLLARWDELNG